MRSDHPPDPTALRRWLAAERAGAAADAAAAAAAAAAAEAALRQLLAALPPLAPPAGFADRVMLRAAHATARRRSVWANSWLQAALLLCVVTCGFALRWLPTLAGTLATLWSPAELLEKSLGELMALHLWLASVLGVGHQLALLCEAVAAPLAIAPLAVLALVCLVVSAAAFRVLRALIQSDRRWVYVDPI